MSRYSIPQDQINQMSMEVVSGVLTDIQQEMCELSGLEYKLYGRRRELEVELHPELVDEQEYEQEVEPPTVSKMSNSQILKLIKLAQRRGISLEDMLP